jgi:beta-glucuronidase
MANETPNSEPRIKFLCSLANTARKLDPTRLISAALEVSNFNGDTYSKTINDPFADMVDILSFNEYIGWYDGLPNKCSKIKWNIKQNKPVIISEFGGGAKYGFHADSLTRWSEEYQKFVYVENLKMLQRIPQLSGMTPWILADFRSPRRPLSNIQDGWNRKGLIDNLGNKKEAFYVLQRFYNQKK